MRGGAILSLVSPLRRHALGAAPDGGIEGGEKGRAIPGREWRGAGVSLARRSEIMHQVANGKRHPDALLGKSTPVGGNDLGARLHAPARQRNGGSDHDVT